jgi:hypothetical protein
MEIDNKQKNNIFEKHPKKTIFFILLIFFIILDFTGAKITIKKSERQAIRSSYYHHDLEPMKKNNDAWGDGSYKLITNSLGFKDKEKRNIELQTNKKRIVIIGDSFTEGIGVPYEKTFVGLADNALDPGKYEILNAAVASYSPKLYYLKIKYLIEEKKLKFDELYVYIDISDIQDEIVYKDFIPSKPNFNWQNFKLDTINFLRDNSITFNSTFKFYVGIREKEKFKNDDFAKNFYPERGSWTFDDAVYKKWGGDGAKLAQNNMQKLADLCRQNNINMHIAVYPWLEHIERKEINSKQVKIWEKFSKENNLDFLNYFPDFINTKAKNDAKKNFIEGDVHWNELGHEIIAKKLIKNIKE